MVQMSMLLKEEMKKKYNKTNDWESCDKISTKVTKEQFVAMVLITPTITAIILCLTQIERWWIWSIGVYTLMFIIWVMVSIDGYLIDKKLKKEIQCELR